MPEFVVAQDGASQRETRRYKTIFSVSTILDAIKVSPSVEITDAHGNKSSINIGDSEKAIASDAFQFALASSKTPELSDMINTAINYVDHVYNSIKLVEGNYCDLTPTQAVIHMDGKHKPAKSREAIKQLIADTFPLGFN